MIDQPKLYTPIIFLVVAALVIAIAWKIQLPTWARFWLAAVAVILGVVGVITLLNWIAYNTSERLKEIGNARTLPMRQIAASIKELTSSQADAILSLNQTYIDLLAEEAGPIFFVRTMTGAVPYDFVTEFFELCEGTQPYLYPVRECSNKDWGAALTNLIVARGWADHATGPLPAKLTRPLSYVAGRFAVDLEEGAEDA